jgi:hypothetical protein
LQGPCRCPHLSKTLEMVPAMHHTLLREHACSSELVTSSYTGITAAGYNMGDGIGICWYRMYMSLPTCSYPRSTLVVEG